MAPRCGHADPTTPSRYTPPAPKPRPQRPVVAKSAPAPKAPAGPRLALPAPGGTARPAWVATPEGPGARWAPGGSERVRFDGATAPLLFEAVKGALARLKPGDVLEPPSAPYLNVNGGYSVTVVLSPAAAKRLAGRRINPPTPTRKALPAAARQEPALTLRSKAELDADMRTAGYYPNRRAGECVVTRAKVPAGEGYILKNDRGGWDVYAAQQAYARAGVSLVAAAVSAKPILSMTYVDGWFRISGPTRVFFDQLRAAGFYTPRDRTTNAWMDYMQSRDLGSAGKFREFADAAARAAIERGEASIALSNTAVGNCEGLPVPVGIGYLPYQCAGIRFGLDRESVLFADDPGLGKTIEALGLINGDPSIRNVVVICPALVKINWRREAEKWLLRPFNYLVADGDTPVAPGVNFVIANFDIVKPYKGADRQIYRDIMARDWDMLIVDEAHFLKNQESDRTIAVFGRMRAKPGKPVAPGIVSRCRRKAFLTGTPIDNRPIDLFPLLHALDPLRWSSWPNFAYRYCGAKRDAYGIKVTGATNTDELARTLRSTIMMRRLKVDVLKELPPKTRQMVILPAEGVRKILEHAFASMLHQALAAEERGQDIDGLLRERFPWYHLEITVEEFTQGWIDMAESLREQAAVAAAKGDKAQYDAISRQLNSLVRVGFAAMSKTRYALAMAKVPYAVEHLATMMDGNDEKVLVMCHHHDVQDAMLAAVAKAFGPDSVVMHRGDMSDTAKQVSVDRFQTDPRVRVFVGSILASGTGITLTAAAKGIFVEFDWKAGTMTQAEDRIYRIGQMKPVLIQHLAFNGTLDAYMIEMLLHKQAQADAIYNPEQAAAMAEQPLMPDGRPAKGPNEQWAVNTLAAYMAGAFAGQRDLKGGRRQGVAQSLDLLSRGMGLPSRRWAFMVAMALYVSGASDRKLGAYTDKPRGPQTAVEEWAARGISALAESDMDRASELNGMGFSQATTSTGHTLAALIAMGRAGDDVWAEAVKLATFHGRQLDPKPGAAAKPAKPAKGAKAPKAAKAVGGRATKENHHGGWHPPGDPLGYGPGRRPARA